MNKRIQGGVYLVIDPAMDRRQLLKQLTSALEGEVAAIQLWDNFGGVSDVPQLLQAVVDLAAPHGVPVLINNRWEWLADYPLAGVHFDVPPADWTTVKARVGEEAVLGLTVNNDLGLIRWADQQALDYISFCSLFPSSTDTSCELVTPASVRAARDITDMPIFLAGGITPANLPSLQDLPFEGVAVVSGIMSANQPKAAVQQYSTFLKTKSL